MHACILAPSYACACIAARIQRYLVQFIHAQVNFMGGDKEAELCKKLDDPEVTTYKLALQELVKAVSIAHYLGKTMDDFHH